MTSVAPPAIPHRAETLEILRLMGEHAPMLWLRGDDDGCGERWTLHGQQVQPAIAAWLMHLGYLADAGATEMGARRLILTPAGVEFRRQGQAWWKGLGVVGRLKAKVLG